MALDHQTQPPKSDSNKPPRIAFLTYLGVAVLLIQLILIYFLSFTHQQIHVLQKEIQLTHVFLQQTQHWIDKQNQQIQDLREQLSSLAINNQPIDTIKMVSEISYLAQLANDKLRFESNSKTAIALLETGLKRLKQNATAPLPSVEKALTLSINQLKQTPNINRPHLLAQLDKLGKQINQLINKTTSDSFQSKETKINKTDETAAAHSISSQQASSNQQTSLSSLWKKVQFIWKKITQQTVIFLKQAVIIQHQTTHIYPLSNNERYLLKATLALDIHLASWAVTQGDTDTYQNSLSDIKQKLLTYQNTSHTPTEYSALLNSVEICIQQSLNSNLPTLTHLLNTLKSVRLNMLQTKQQVTKSPQQKIEKLDDQGESPEVST